MVRTTYRFEGRVTTWESALVEPNTRYAVAWKRGTNAGEVPGRTMGPQTVVFGSDFTFATTMDREKAGGWRQKMLTLTFREVSEKPKDIGRTEVMISSLLPPMDAAHVRLHSLSHPFLMQGEMCNVKMDVVMYPEKQRPPGLHLNPFSADSAMQGDVAQE
eukprot:gene20428-31443_t